MVKSLPYFKYSDRVCLVRIMGTVGEGDRGDSDV